MPFVSSPEMRVSKSSFPFSITFEIEVKGAKEFGSTQESLDKEQIELVIKRVANEDGMAVLPRC